MRARMVLLLACSLSLACHTGDMASVDPIARPSVAHAQDVPALQLKGKAAERAFVKTVRKEMQDLVALAKTRGSLSTAQAARLTTLQLAMRRFYAFVNQGNGPQIVVNEPFASSQYLGGSSTVISGQSGDQVQSNSIAMGMNNFHSLDSETQWGISCYMTQCNSGQSLSGSFGGHLNINECCSLVIIKSMPWSGLNGCFMMSANSVHDLKYNAYHVPPDPDMLYGSAESEFTSDAVPVGNYCDTGGGGGTNCETVTLEVQWLVETSTGYWQWVTIDEFPVQVCEYET